jgi:hypothetical protein
MARVRFPSYPRISVGLNRWSKTRRYCTPIATPQEIQYLLSYYQVTAHAVIWYCKVVWCGLSAIAEWGITEPLGSAQPDTFIMHYGMFMFKHTTPRIIQCFVIPRNANLALALSLFVKTWSILWCVSNVFCKRIQCRPLCLFNVTKKQDTVYSGWQEYHN